MCLHRNRSRLRSATSRRLVALRPNLGRALELLDRRCCPSCLVSFDPSAGALTIIGDNTDNVVEIHDLGVDGVTVFCPSDPSRPQTFTGVQTIEVRTGNGADRVDYMLDSPNPPTRQTRIDLGNGDDAFNFVFVRPGPCRPVEAQPVIDIGVIGGRGNDTFQTFVGMMDTTEVASGPCTELRLSYDGGPGADSMIDYIRGLDLTMPVSLTRTGGSGDDQFMENWSGVTIDAPVTTNLDGGAGHDDIRVIYGFNPQPDPPAIPLIVNSALVLNADGGDGADTIGADVAWQVNAGAQTAIGLHGGAGPDVIRMGPLNHIAPGATSSFVMTGDGGDDTLEFNYDHAVVQGTLLVSVSGGDGADQISASISPSVRPGGLIDASFNGGAGDDSIHTSLDEIDTESTGTARIMVDAGAGNDTVTHTVGDVYGEADYQADLGDGTNAFAVTILPRTEFALPSEVPPLIEVAVTGGGTNTFDAMIGGREPAGASVPFIDGDVQLSFTGDGTARVQGANVAIRGDLTISLTGGAEADGMAVGLDHLSAHSIAVSAAGGGGTDLIAVIANDVTTSDEFDMILDGGAGNDVVIASLGFDPASPGTVRGDVLGGAGDDLLAFNLVGVTDAQIVQALIDGGAGLDMAIHSANVQVINCEL